MSRVLVTGGAGFIGSHLVDKLVAEGHEVKIIDDFSGGSWENLKQYKTEAPFQTFLWMCDLRDSEKTSEFFEHFQPKIVYHLAANAAENKAQFSPIDVTSRNYSAFINTLTPFIKYGGKRFVFTSSIAVYGALQTPFKETDKPEPEDLYGITKLAAEQTLKVMSQVHGFEYVIARPHNVYGPRQNMKDPYRNVVTIFMNCLLRGDPLPIYGDGEQVRQFSYIDDVVEQLVSLESGVHNIGSNGHCTINKLASLVEEVSGIKTGRIYLPTRPQEVKEALAQNTPFPATEMKLGIQKTWEWCKQQGAQEPIYTKLEIDSPKIPQNWRKH